MFLQLCELTFNKTRHLRNPYNENLPVKVIVAYFLVRLKFGNLWLGGIALYV